MLLPIGYNIIFREADQLLSVRADTWLFEPQCPEINVGMHAFDSESTKAVVTWATQAGMQPKILLGWLRGNHRTHG